MARKEKLDRTLGNLMEEVEQKMFLVKMEYEKYFAGIERIEPLRERETIKRMLREMESEHAASTTQRFKLQTLKSRYQSMELYWTRNLIQIERGTHSKMKFRADLHAKPIPGVAVEALSNEQVAVLEERRARAEREERSYKLVYDKYLEARQKCGQSTEISFEAVREALHKQVRLIKSTYQTEQVKFRILIEDGKAKVKALPQT